jgi:hypothetical protein
MEKVLKRRCFFNVISLIFIVSFLFFPKNIFAEDIVDIKLEDYGKYLELPEDKTGELIKSLVQIFNSEWINLESSAYSTAEQRAVPIVMRKAIRVQALNHLLKEAPLEVAVNIIKNSVEIARIFLTKDVPGILDKIEKESIQRAITYGVNTLLQNEIKTAPGIISFNYKTQKNQEKKADFQYIIIYKPTSVKNGDIKIRFYSPFSIAQPKNEGSIGGLMGTPNDLTGDLPPFIVDVQGTLENYKWVGTPSVNISFPSTVPDLGIKPLSFQEKYLLKPIESTIKEVEIIITKVAGKTSKLNGIWGSIKTVVSKISSFLPASVSNTQNTQPTSSANTINELNNNILNIVKLSNDLSLQIDYNEPEIVSDESGDSEPPKEKKLTLEEIQEMLDDIAEKIDILSRQIAGLTGSNLDQIVLSDIKKEVKGVSDEIEETIEDNEENSGIETYSYQGALLCSNLSQSPQRKAIINEIAWMGTLDSANNEWIELKNMSGSPIDMIGWQLLSKDGGVKIIFDNNEKSVPLSNLFLLERTDDYSVLQKTADFIYTGAISNNNEEIYLFDANCQLQDEVFANPNWLAGDNSSKRTMERSAGFGWQTSFSSGGTPKEENSAGYYEYVSGGGGGGSSSSASQPSSPELKTEVCSLENLGQPIHSSVIINEIAWMGSGSTSADEWIELKNISTSIINLNDWQLIGANASTSEDKIEIFFEETDFVATNSLYLLERTDDESVPGIAADKIFTGAINDSSFIFRLFNANCGLMDEVLATSTWPAGQKTPEHKTMERKDDITWQTSFSTTSINSLFGTPKAENSKEESQQEEQESTSTEDVGSLEVVINEIAWMGTGPSDSSDEWIELYNNTDSAVDLTDWQILKEGEFIKISTSSGTTIIPASGFFLLERTASDTTSLAEDQIYHGDLRNTGEKLELRNASGTLIDLIDCSSGWFAGTSSPYYVSMERIDSRGSGATSTNWANNNLITRNGISASLSNINGTPKSKNSVSVSPTTITGLPFDEFSELTLTYFGSPYVVEGYLIVPQNKVLNIEPGVVMKFRPYGGFEINGILNASGESDKKIIFTSLDEWNYWHGIYFTPLSGDSKIDWTEIKYGRVGGGDPSEILVSSSRISLTNSVLSNYSDRGLRLVNSSSSIENTDFYGIESLLTTGIEIEGGSPTIKNCGMIKNNAVGIYVENLSAGDIPVIEGNNFENNGTVIYSLVSNVNFKNNRGKNNSNNLIVINGVISADNLVWYKNEMPYSVLAFLELPSGKNLNVGPGATVIFNMESYFLVEGTLIARGTETESIVFTGNGWCSLIFSDSTSSVLENVIVNGGGYCRNQPMQGQVLVGGSAIEFLNSTSSNGYGAGIYLTESASIIKNSCSIGNTYGIYINTDHELCPITENLALEGNQIKGYSSATTCAAQMGF